jgi:predicted PurR-regulated permease PerM
MGGILSACIGIIAPIEGMSAIHTFFTIGFILFAIKGFDDFVLQPTIYSERVKAHPLEVFLVILTAGHVAGITGMLLAIPSYTVIRVLAKEFFSEFALVQKLTQNI